MWLIPYITQRTLLSCYCVLGCFRRYV